MRHGLRRILMEMVSQWSFHGNGSRRHCSNGYNILYLVIYIKLEQKLIPDICEVDHLLWIAKNIFWSELNIEFIFMVEIMVDKVKLIFLNIGNDNDHIEEVLWNLKSD